MGKQKWKGTKNSKKVKCIIVVKSALSGLNAQTRTSKNYSAGSRNESHSAKNVKETCSSWCDDEGTFTVNHQMFSQNIGLWTPVRQVT